MHATQHGVAPTVTTPASVLRNAACYLDRHGWIQGAYYDAAAVSFTPAACTVGALGMVCYGGPVDAPALNDTDPNWADFTCAQDYLDEYLSAVLPYDVDAYGYNDHPGRTRDQVIAMLTNAADAWDRVHPCHVCGASCSADDGPICTHCPQPAEASDGSANALDAVFGGDVG